MELVFDPAAAKKFREAYFMLMEEPPHKGLLFHLSEEDLGPKKLDFDNLSDKLKKIVERALQCGIVKRSDVGNAEVTVEGEDFGDIVNKVADSVKEPKEPAKKENKRLHPKLRERAKEILKEKADKVVREAKFLKGRGDLELLNALKKVESSPKGKKRKGLLTSLNTIIGMDNVYESEITESEQEEVEIKPTSDEESEE